MQYRNDKRTGNQLSALGFGCMRFPGGIATDKAKTEELLLDAYKNGVNYYDTAYMYPGSEDTLGEILAKHKLREKVYIATKLPHIMCGAPSDLDKFFETQKKRLRTDYIDYYMMHNITDFKQWEKLKGLGIEDWIARKKAAGEIRQIGFSFHGSYNEFEKMLDAYNWDFTQIQYNYINTNYQAGTKGLKLAESKGLSVIIMEPLLGGKLANLPGEAADLLRGAKPDSTPVEWALRFVWDAPGATVVLSGMNRPAQLTENLRTAENAVPGNLSEAERGVIQKVKDIFSRSYKVPCTGCNYCMPCPKGINIPACFEAYNTSFAVKRSAGLQQYLTTIGAGGAYPHFASDCVRCGKCEKHCPQQIKIPDELVNVKRRLEIPGLKGILKFVGKRMGGK